MFLSDKNSNGPQFSKVTVLICILIAIIGISFSVYAAVIFCLDPTIVATLITTCGCMGITAQVWYLKKSQAENTTKIYLSAYKEIIDIKKSNNEDTVSTIDDLENNILNKMNNTLDYAIDEAVSPIEKQDII